MQRWERQSAGDDPWHGVISAITDPRSANSILKDRASEVLGASSTQAERGSSGRG